MDRPPSQDGSRHGGPSDGSAEAGKLLRERVPRESSSPGTTGYHYILLGVVVLYLVIIVVSTQQVGGPLRVAVLGVLALVTIRTGRRAGALATPMLVLVLLAVTVTVVAAIVDNATVQTCVSQASTAVLAVSMIVVLARTLLAARVIDGRAVGGVLTIYLLLGLMFSAAQGFFAALVTDYLDGVTGHPTPSDTLYFSLITLTTVGYGDITPAANLARAIASVEALTGQLYLVSIVAAVVAHFRPSRPLRSKATSTRTSHDARSGGPDSAAGDDGGGKAPT